MRAIEFHRYGPPDVLKLSEVPRPVPREDELLVRVRATTVTATDALMRRGDKLQARLVLGLFRPRRRFRVMGLEVAGDVVQVGPAVTRFAPGDRVYGFTGFGLGGYAEYCRLRETASVALCGELSYGDAATLVDGGTTAIFFLDLAKLKRGEQVLIIGASGSVGSAAVQVAAARGAHVTGLCSGRNRELVASLGAHEVIDYTRQDYAQTGRTWDVIFDTVTKSSFGHAKPALAAGGRYLPTVGGLAAYLRSAWSRCVGGRARFLFGMSISKQAELAELARLVSRGALRPVIDRRYPLEQLAEAHAYVDSGRKRGNVMITVDPGG